MRNIVLILIGLDNAGKTMTVNNLAGDVDGKTLPTVGFKAVNLLHRDIPVTIYDLGGGPQFRQIWPQYYSEVHGVIFVIDSSDFSRLDECKNVLEEVLSHDKISGKPILVLANKQDKEGALDDIDVVDKLNIEPLVNKYRCPTLVESYSASIFDDKSRKPKIDPGLMKGYNWLLNYIESRYGDINLRVQTDIHCELERRRRVMNKSRISEEVTSETGFENPNYKTLTRETTTISNDRTDSDIIIVKPAKNNTLESTMSVTDNSLDSVKAKPKLSPLFGKSNRIVETVKVELEPKTEFRKLSPILKTPAFQSRPLSVDKTYVKDTDLAVMNDRRKVVGDEVELNQVRQELFLTQREAVAGKSTTSEVCLQSSPNTSQRPASASQLIRKQLEIFPATHKRRYSLRYGQRNKTSPETPHVFECGKRAPRLDKGDFEAHSYLAQRDVTL